MDPLIIYTAKAAVYLTAFWFVYRIFLHHDTMHGRNRAFIIISVLSAMILPLITVHTSKPLNLPTFGKVLSEVLITGSVTEVSMTENTVLILSVFKWLTIIYVSGLVLFLAKFTVDLLELFLLITRKRSRGSNLIRIEGLGTSGFSAFGHIFINSNLSHQEEKEIIRHEQNHLDHNHSSDIVFIEFMKALQWFNPAIHLFERSLRAVHEYQADQECITRGTSISTYQKLLLNQIFRSRIFRISNSFSNPSMVKKRIIMMSKKPTASFANLKLLIIIPVIASILLAFSTCTEQRPLPGETQEEAYPPPPPPPPPQSGEETATQNQKPPPRNIEPFVLVEQMPYFPGGEIALLKFIMENTNYPESAKNAGTQGKVIVRFCIDEQGRAVRESVLKGVSPDIDAEALRVVRLLPLFEPGRQGGKAVPVWYMVPINFTLK
ncbi:MAG: TonB family protein [Bacteroidales bacterium]|nr:TonB family protein [Bacteroidales bacterium]